MKDLHLINLENMYLAAPINAIYQPTITVSEKEAEIIIAVKEDYFHSAGAVHGSVYFKMLDDAAFFAANSLEREFFILTSSFVTYLTRPITSGYMKSIGRVVNQTKTQILAEAIVFNAEDKEIARGNGIFVRGKFRLADALGYSAQ